jgi:hypothetical protein
LARVRVYINGDKVGPTIGRVLATQSDLVREGVQAAAIDFVSAFRARAAADIAGAGKFGSRWTDGFTATVSQGGGNVKIDITHQVPYFNVFQYGATIRGKPMLWIPLSFASDAKGILARNYGRLFRVDRKVGAPLLLAPGKPAQPKYFGKESVTIPKKFHTVEIAREMAQGFREFYYARRRAQGV